VAKTFTRPSGSAIAAIIVVACVAVFVIVGSFSKGELVKGPEPLLPERERPLKTMVVSTYSDGEQIALARLVQGFDEGNVFNLIEGDLDLSVADVILFQMPSFAAYADLPRQDLLGGVYDQLSTVTDKDTVVSREVLIDNSRKMQMVFYNMTALDGVTPECLVRHLGGMFAPGATDSVQSFSACGATP